MMGCIPTSNTSLTHLGGGALSTRPIEDSSSAIETLLTDCPNVRAITV